MHRLFKPSAPEKQVQELVINAKKQHIREKEESSKPDNSAEEGHPSLGC
jgi:hypothetical protein